MLGVAGVLRSGVSNPRFAYMPINPARPGALTFASALGAQHLSALDFQLGQRRIECHRIDYGPGGLFAAMRAVVYAELGLALPRAREVDEAVDVEAVREALRNFRIPHELARSPLAKGGTPEQRAESVRDLLRAAGRRVPRGSNLTAVTPAQG
jgi:hypothetical protein